MGGTNVLQTIYIEVKISLDESLSKNWMLKIIGKNKHKELTAKKNELVEHIKELEKKLLQCLSHRKPREESFFPGFPGKGECHCSCGKGEKSFFLVNC